MKVYGSLALLTPALAGDYGLFRNNAEPVEYKILNVLDTTIWTMWVQSVFE